MITSDFSPLLQVMQQAPGYSPQEWDEVLPFLSVQHLNPKQQYLRAGEQAHNVALIANGLVRMYYLDRAGSEFNRAFIGQLGFTGSLTSLLSGIKSLYFIEALEPTDLILIDLLPLMQRPWIKDVIFAQLLDVFQIKERREAAFLMKTAAERYETFVKEQGWLLDRVSDAHIASFLGMTPVHLSRLKKSRKSLAGLSLEV